MRLQASLAAACLLLVPATAAAAPGELDKSFGGTGLVVRDGTTFDAAVQADGKVVRLSRSFELARYTTAGELDGSFGGGDGVVEGITGDAGDAVLVQPDGRIVAVGERSVPATGLDVLVRRFLPDGTPDPGFGSGGAAVTAVAAGTGADRSFAVALAPDGAIVVAGCTTTESSCSSSGPSEGSDTLVVRYTPAGLPDPAFSQDGVAVVPLAPGTRGDKANGVAVRPDGTVVVGGTADVRAGQGDAQDQDFAVLQLTPGGQPDTAFAGTGIWTFGITAQGSRRDDARAGVVLQPDGKILIGGQSGPSETAAAFAVARLDAAGALDAGFGSGGVAQSLPGPTNATVGRGMALQPDGRVVLVGHDDFDGDGILAVRYTTAGLPDPTFGTEGEMVIANDGPTNSVRVGPDGRLVIAGGLGISGFVGRLLGDQADLGSLPRPAILLSPSPVGTPITDGLSVQNRGPQSATAITEEITIPAGVQLLSVSPSQGSCLVGTRIACAFGDLASSASAFVAIRFTAASPGRYTFAGTFASLTPDPVPTNNRDFAGGTFVARRPLTIFEPLRSPDRTAPRVTAVTLSRTAFRRARGKSRLAFRLSEAASVRLTFDRVRRVRGRDRFPRVPGSIALVGKRGVNGRTLTARLASRTRRVAPGRYRVALVATDPAGNRPAAVRRSFTVRR